MSLDEKRITRVVHVITGLGVGGAEIMLARLLSALDTSIASRVVCLSSGGPVADRIRATGVQVDVLGLPSGPLALLGLARLVRVLREPRPDLVHTWLYHADLLGGLAAKYCGIPVIWGLHNATLDSKRLGHVTVGVIRLLAKLSSSVPLRVVSCSDAGRRAHEAGGYDAKRMLVIQNGFDAELFRPNAVLRSDARRAWGFTNGELVVGLIARFSPLKDHETFLRACGIALNREPRLRFVLYGDRVSPQNSALLAWADAAGIRKYCMFLGSEPAVERRLPGLDLLVSSSISEAFPLILGEAMASGVPCVTTDVGDSAVIVADPARVVRPRDPLALANAIVRAVQLDPVEREAQVNAGIAHIRSRFALPAMARRFRDLYVDVATSQL